MCRIALNFVIENIITTKVANTELSSTYDSLCFINFGTYIGDNFCDDFLNKKECDYDGGDCCNWQANKNTCSLCKCHGPGYLLTEPITGTSKKSYLKIIYSNILFIIEFRNNNIISRK